MRPLWSCSIVLGSLSVPVKLYSATKKSNVDFVQIDTRDNNRVRQVLVNAETGEEIEPENLGKAFINEGNVVPVPSDFVSNLLPVRNNLLNFNVVVESSNIERVWFDNFYYLFPEDGYEPQYLAVLQSLRAYDVIPVCKAFYRNNSHVFGLSHYKEGLILHKLRFYSEIVEPDPALYDQIDSCFPDLPFAENINEALDEHLTFFDPPAYYNEFAERVVGAIQSQLCPR